MQSEANVVGAELEEFDALATAGGTRMVTSNPCMTSIQRALNTFASVQI